MSVLSVYFESTLSIWKSCTKPNESLAIFIELQYDILTNFSRNHASRETYQETLADAASFEESNFNKVDEDGLIDDGVSISSFE